MRFDVGILPFNATSKCGDNVGWHLRLSYKKFVKLPQWRFWRYFSLSYNEGELFVRWRDSDITDDSNEGYKIIHMPWQHDHYATYYLSAADTWVISPKKEFSRAQEYTVNKKTLVREIMHVRPSGEVQERTMSITVSRWEWSTRILKRLHLDKYFPRMVRVTADIKFDQEIGRGSGSWKGGLCGLSRELKPNETLEEFAERFLQEYDFESK